MTSNAPASITCDPLCFTLQQEDGTVIETFSHDEAREYVRERHNIPAGIDIPNRTLAVLFPATLCDSGRWWGVQMDGSPHRWNPSGTQDMLVCIGDLIDEPELKETFASLWVLAHQSPDRPRLAEIKAKIETALEGAFTFPVWAEVDIDGLPSDDEEDPQAMD